MIVAFAGRIASGKSAVSKAVAEHYSLDRVSFGDAVRSEARRRGDLDTRASLQALGDELIVAGWDVFCALVTGQVDWDGHSSLVVDGVRHLGALDALRRLAGSSGAYLVFVDAPWERRRAWLAERGVGGPEAVAADRHPNESELDAVMGQANLVVDNHTYLDRVVAQVVRTLDEVLRP
jgi:adenylate kinase family enzyme